MMDAPPLHNDTELIAEPHLLIGREGEQLVVVVKATFERVDGVLELAPAARMRPIRGADVPWGDPAISSIKYPSDLCITKPGTDVIVVATAHAPNGVAVPTFDAGVRVGSLHKAVRVFGLRVWEGPGSGLSAPKNTTAVEVRYDNAWGGSDMTDLTQPLEEPRNPVGRGIARDLSSLRHQPAPSIEDVSVPLHSVETRPPPGGLSAIGRHWLPRRHYLGTYDDAWLEEQAPLLPDDFDDRANLCASPGLIATPPLQGNEEVALVNLTPRGSATFKLPHVRVAITCERQGQEPKTVRPYLDTLLLDTIAVPDDADVTVELVWRAVFHPPRRMKQAELFVSEDAA